MHIASGHPWLAPCAGRMAGRRITRPVLPAPVQTASMKPHSVPHLLHPYRVVKRSEALRVHVPHLMNPQMKLVEAC